MAVQTLTVAGEGSITSGWVAEGGDYTRLQSNDGDTSRLYTPLAGHVRLVTLSDTSGLGTATINSVTVTASVRSLDPVPNTVQIGVRVGGTNYWGSTKDTNPATTYQTFTETWLTSPATGSAWTTSELDALEAGLQKVNSVGMGWSYLKADVDYTTGGGGTPPIATGSTFTMMGV